MAKHKDKKSHAPAAAPDDPGYGSIVDLFTPALAEWRRRRPPRIVTELTFRSVVEYFVRQHPGDASIQSGALLRMPHPRGHAIFQVFLDPDSKLSLDSRGRPYGRQLIAMSFDAELSARLQDTDLIIFQ
jgi:hypothetical protein